LTTHYSRRAPFPGWIFLPDQSTKTEFVMTEASSLDGIISSISTTHGRFLHDQGIITVDSSLVNIPESDSPYGDSHCDEDEGDEWSETAQPPNPAKNVLGLNSESYFESGSGSQEWISRDFHDLRVRPSHDTIVGGLRDSWVLESSQDGGAWLGLDRPANGLEWSPTNQSWCTGSFMVSHQLECRFIWPV
jgi:hypothetical protein